jgi:putative peptidoglycan lipid II flippase
MFRLKLKTLFTSQSKTITSAAIILGASSLISRLFGVLRDRVLASQFGAGSELDMYYAAFRIPDLIFNLLILGSLSAGFIPVFTGILANKKKAWELVNIVFNLIVFSLLAISAVLVLIAPGLVALITPGFKADQLAITVRLTQIMFLSLMFLGISGIFGSVLQSLRSFFIYSIAPILYNIGIIFGAIFLVPYLGIYGLAWGVVAGAFLHMLIQLAAAYNLGYRWQWVLDLKNKSLQKILILMVPRTLGLIVTQINFLVVTVIGSTLAAGSIAVFNLANNIQSLPLGLFGVSFAVAAFPALSELADHKKKFIETLSLAIRQIMFLVVPSSALLIVLRAQVVRVVLGSGKFSWNDTVLTLETLSFFAFSLFAQSLILLLARAYYARQDTKTPFFAGIASALFNIALSLYLVKYFGVLGLALAFSLANILNFALLAFILRLQLGSLDETRILFSTAKILVASFMMAIVAQAIKYPMVQLMGLNTFWGIALQMIAATSGGLATYIFVGWLVKCEELTLFIDSLRKRVLRQPAIPEAIIEQGPIQDVS